MYLKLLDKLKAQFKLEFMLVDMEKYNEKRVLEYQQKKLEAANVRDFESAAWYRTLEDECKEYIDLKNSLNVASPKFVCDGGLLLYFFYGHSLVELITKDVFISHTNKITSDGMF